MKKQICWILLIFVLMIATQVYSMDTTMNINDELFKYQCRMVIYIFPSGMLTYKPIPSISELKNAPYTSKIDVSNYILMSYKDALEVFNNQKKEIKKKDGHFVLGCEFIRKSGEIILSVSFSGNGVMVINNKYYQLDIEIENFIRSFIPKALSI